MKKGGGRWGAEIQNPLPISKFLKIHLKSSSRCNFYSEHNDNITLCKSYAKNFIILKINLFYFPIEWLDKGRNI